MIRPRFASLLLAAALLAAAPAPAQTPSPGPRENVPRFVSLRSDEVNLRAGPGINFPIEWVIKRRHLPVEVLAEFQQWRKIRDGVGTEGWVHQSMLAGRRYAVVIGDARTIRRAPEPAAAPVAKLEPGVVAQLLECRGEWCRLEAGGFRGWLARAGIWGVYPDEAVK